MTTMKFSKLLGSLLLLFVFSIPAVAQSSPEMSVNGVRLGDRTSGKAFLEKFSVTSAGEGRFAYFFFNDFGDKVWKLTVAAFEDRFMIVEMEVFIAGKNYSKPHFYLKKVDQFVTESGLFVGKKDTVSAALLGDGLATDTRIGPKDLIKKKGEPTSRSKEGETEILRYDLTEVGIDDELDNRKKVKYSARYEFRDNRLKRFVIGIGER